MHRIGVGGADHAQQEHTGLPLLQRSELSHGVFLAERSSEPSSLSAEALRLVLQRHEAWIPAYPVPGISIV